MSTLLGLIPIKDREGRIGVPPGMHFEAAELIAAGGFTLPEAGTFGCGDGATLSLFPGKATDLWNFKVADAPNVGLTVTAHQENVSAVVVNRRTQNAPFLARIGDEIHFGGFLVFRLVEVYIDDDEPFALD